MKPIRLLVFLALVAPACGRNALKAGAAGGSADAATSDGARDGGPSNPDARPADGARDGSADVPAGDVRPADRPSDTIIPPTGLVAITVMPGMAGTSVGVTVRFTAIGRYTDGRTADLTASATWTSSMPGLAMVAGGQARAVAPGTTTIVATVMGISGQAMLVITAAPLVAVIIDPSDIRVPVAGRFSARAYGQFADGMRLDVTTQVMWSSVDPSIASVSSGPGGGVVAGVRAGSTAITASLQGMMGKASVTVSGATVTGLEISPAAPTLPPGAAQQLTATAFYSDGSKGDVTGTATWESNDPMVVSVNGGLVAALRPGTALVTARLGNVFATTTVTVTRVPIGAIRIDPGTAVAPRGTTQAYRAYATFADGTVGEVTQSVTWSVDDAAVASISNAPGSQGLATAVGVGTTRVIARLGMVTGEARMTVSDATVTGLSITPKTATVAVAATLAMTATATFSDGTQKDVTALTMWSVSDPGSATIGSDGRLTGLRPGGVAVMGTYGGASDAVKVLISTATLASIEVTPGMMALVAGARGVVMATGIYSDGTKLDITNQVMWSSDDPMVATVSNAAFGGGIVVGVGEGSTTVRARLDGQEGSAFVVVTGVTLVQLSISPILPSRRVGEFVQFGASAIRSNNTSQNVTNMATWTSSDPNVAPVSNMMMMGMPRGRATCRSPGTTVITARYMGLEDSTTLTCNPPATLVALQVTPFLSTIQVGQNQPLQATAIFSDGSTQMVNMMATWTSSMPMVADVTNLMMRGLVTGISAGTATITATYQGLSGTADVTVLEATLVRLSLSPALNNLKVGQQQQLTASAIYSDNTVRNVTGMTTFMSDDPRVAAVSNAGGPGPGGGGGRGQVTAIGEGTTVITGTFMGLSDSVIVDVTAPKLTMIQVTPTNPTLLVGGAVQFQAVAVYSDFTVQNVTGMAIWQSKDPMVAAVASGGGMRGTATALAAGQTTIIANFMGVSGATELTVSAATITEIQVTPVNPSVPMGVTVNFTAIAILSDNTQRNVTNTATWFSSNPDVVDVTNTGGRGVAFTLMPGMAKVLATQGNVSGTVVITVGSQTLSGITVAPAMATIARGAAQQFTATGNYSDGSTYPLTGFVTWLSTNLSSAAISNAGGTRGLATGVGAGTASIEAHFQGQTGTAALVVTP